MPPKDHLSDNKKEAILALHRHGFSQKDIAGDIYRHTTTVLRFLDLHRRVVRGSLLKNEKKVLVRTSE